MMNISLYYQKKRYYRKFEMKSIGLYGENLNLLQKIKSQKQETLKQGLL